MDPRSFAIIKTIIVTVILFFQSLSAGASDLVVLTWSDYMDPELVEQFEKKHNIKVRFIYFEDDDSRDKMLINSAGRGFDLVLVNDAALGLYQKRGWLAPVENKRLPNLKHTGVKWLKQASDGRYYGVPYFWGTLGIAYRKDLVHEKIASWKQLFEPSEELRGKIVMMATNRDVIGMALKSLGFSVNSDDKEALEKARRLLLAQRPYVKKYAYIAVTAESALVTGDVSMAMVFNGDALAIKEFNQNIEFVVPEEGSNIWVDYFAVMKSSVQKNVAFDFINFMNAPQVAAQQAAFVYYATPNAAAEKRMPAEYLSDPVIYPSKTILEKSEYYRDLPAKIIKQRNQIMSELLH